MRSIFKLFESISREQINAALNKLAKRYYLDSVPPLWFAGVATKLGDNRIPYIEILVKKGYALPVISKYINGIRIKVSSE